MSLLGPDEPAIQELCLMPVTRQWLPVADGFEKQLLDRLVGETRCFVKGLHYNLGRSDWIALSSTTPSRIGFWKALRPEMRPMPPARLLITAVRTASCRSFSPEAPPELMSPARPR